MTLGRTIDQILGTATHTRQGVVRLAEDGEVHADEAVAADDSRLSNERTPTPHGLVSDRHTVSGLTPGHVLTALTATSVGFQEAAGSGNAWTPLTNGDPAAPALIWDSFGQVVMCEVPR